MKRTVPSSITLAVVCVAAVIAALAASARAGALTFASRAGSPQASSNWAGYAAVAPAGAAVNFTDVTGTWVQPKVRCVKGQVDAAAFWVGLGGLSTSSQSLEQLGTSAQCSGSSGTATYDVWWEIIPAAAVHLPLKVVPGDKLTAAVAVSGQRVALSVKSLTRGWHFSKTITVGHALDVSSAEWVAEAPTSCTSSSSCRLVTLADFGQVAFTDAATTGNGHPGTLADPTWIASPIELVSRGFSSTMLGRGSTVSADSGAVPGELTADGRSFTVSWRQNVTPSVP
jgi:hypothetical protein